MPHTKNASKNAANSLWVEYLRTTVKPGWSESYDAVKELLILAIKSNPAMVRKYSTGVYRGENAELLGEFIGEIASVA